MTNPFSQRWLALISILSAAIGVSIAIAGEAWWLSAIPNLIAVKSAQIRHVKSIRGEHWLDVEIVGGTARSCTRQSFHVIYKDIPGGTIQRLYAPLAMSLSNPSFPTSGSHFIVNLEIPPGLATGDWKYVDRSIYTCVIWPGFVHQVAEESKPIVITLPEEPD